jgi:hypothetical protein
MSRIIRMLATYALAAAGVAGLVFLSACNVTSSTAGGTARLNVLMTDAPSDDWSVVSVDVTSVSLRNADTQSWVSAWTGVQNVNLVDMSGVSTILGSPSIQIPSATYDRLKLTIDPTTFSLTDNNTPPKIYSGTDITVVDSSGKGEIKVDISPAVSYVGTGTVWLDFDLAHPLSIIVQNGKVIINLQVRHKALPRNLRDIQFARSLGNVTTADTTNKSSFTLKTLEGAELTFGVNTDTHYVYVDDATATADFDGLAGLAGLTDKGALVASNMNSDGTLYARQVWYGTLALLPQFTPEGVVRAVGDNWIKVLNKNANNTDGEHMSCHWDSDIIYVNDATTWTFHDRDTVKLPSGTAMLKNIRRGFRVVVTLDATAAPTKLATSINIQSAHDEGAIGSVSATGFTFGGSGYHDGWNCAPGAWQHYTHEWLYSMVTHHWFSWWFYGMPSVTSTDQTVAAAIQDFFDTVTQAKSANLRVFAWAELYWNGDATSGQWAAENVVLAPEKLPDPTRISANYVPNADPKTGGYMAVSTFDWDDETLPTPMTVFLDGTGDLQTVVGSLLWNSTSRILTFTVPVLPENWEALLKSSLLGVRVWVRPVKTTDGTTTTWTWHAYTVMAFQVIS